MKRAGLSLPAIPGACADPSRRAGVLDRQPPASELTETVDELRGQLALGCHTRPTDMKFPKSSPPSTVLLRAISGRPPWSGRRHWPSRARPHAACLDSPA